MWWFKAYSFAFFVGLSCCLAGCGFRPLHTAIGEQGSVAYPVKIGTISDRYGQILRNRLVDLLTPGGVPCKPLYILDVVVSETILDTGVLVDETISRKQIVEMATLTLRDCCGRVLYTHSIPAVNSFAVLDQTYYANTVTESYSKKEAMYLLADKIKTLINIYFETHGKN